MNATERLHPNRDSIFSGGGYRRLGAQPGPCFRPLAAGRLVADAAGAAYGLMSAPSRRLSTSSACTTSPVRCRLNSSHMLACRCTYS